MFTLGVVPYLNAWPLYKTLEARADIRIVAHVPSQLSRVLARGEVDVALLPVVEHFRGVGEKIISNSCIGCTRDVRSVLLFSRVPFEAIQSVALDMSSRTSVALTKVVLADSFGLSPFFYDAPPNLEAMLRECESALLIGDPALIAVQNLSRDENHQLRVLDLGAAWFELTKLPFVFAAWVTRRGLESCDEIAQLLNAARENGISQIETIARNAAQTSALSQTTIESYYRHAIQYELTAAHCQGLDEFRRRCALHELLSSS